MVSSIDTVNVTAFIVVLLAALSRNWRVQQAQIKADKAVAETERTMSTLAQFIH